MDARKGLFAPFFFVPLVLKEGKSRLTPKSSGDGLVKISLDIVNVLNTNRDSVSEQ